MSTFNLVTEFELAGDQPRAVDELCAGVQRGDAHQVLLGVTGSGKTFTVANAIARLDRPALVIAPNKTLAAQLFEEFRELFPDNAVEYFVSYYDYYQPEAYVPSTDTYIEKDSQVNERIDRLRHAATHSLLTRRDVIIVASVSCIYGLGSAEAYYGMLVFLEQGKEAERDTVLRKLVEIQYERNDVDFHRGTFRVRGDVLEIFPAYEESRALRVEFFGDEVEAIREIDPLRGTVLRELPRIAVYPGSHYVTPPEERARALSAIREELGQRLKTFRDEGRLLEAQRLEQRTIYDLEMMETLGRCKGIENYSRHLTGREQGRPPPTLLDYFPDDFLLFVDESHVTVPQVGGMYRGDRARKETLVEHGFRLPSALDNRPLKFEEFRERVGQAMYVSATPGEWELERTGGAVVEQVIRPTGLADPAVEVRPASEQVDDLLAEIRETVDQGFRVLVTTLTKRTAEDLTDYYQDLGLKVRYLHSDIDTLERTEILRELRLGEFDVLVGINLLREGLDLPEVALVGILDADKEGFLRSTRSLIQTTGRAARNIEGRVILYADRETDSIRAALAETERRRARQLEYNAEHGITPESVKKNVRSGLGQRYEADYVTVPVLRDGAEPMYLEGMSREQVIDELRRLMFEAAAELDFEKAADLRDQIRAMEDGEPLPSRGRKKPRRKRQQGRR